MPFRVTEVQPTPNPNAAKFVLDRPVSQQPVSYLNSAAAKDDPLARSLFAIPGVSSAPASVAVDPSTSWSRSGASKIMVNHTKNVPKNPMHTYGATRPRTSLPVGGAATGGGIVSASGAGAGFGSAGRSRTVSGGIVSARTVVPSCGQNRASGPSSAWQVGQFTRSP